MVLLAFSLQDQIDKYGTYVGIAAFFGLAVLTLLYFAQAREVKRLREWAGRAPERAAELEMAVQEHAEEVRRVPATPVPAPQPVAAPRSSLAVGAGRPTASSSSSPPRSPRSPSRAPRACTSRTSPRRIRWPRSPRRPPRWPPPTRRGRRRASPPPPRPSTAAAPAIRPSRSPRRPPRAALEQPPPPPLPPRRVAAAPRPAAAPRGAAAARVQLARRDHHRGRSASSCSPAPIFGITRLAGDEDDPAPQDNVAATPTPEDSGGGGDDEPATTATPAPTHEGDRAGRRLQRHRRRPAWPPCQATC